MIKKVWKGVWKGALRHVTLRSVLGGLGGAMVASVGWKIGNDAYDAIKKRMTENERRRAEAAEEEDEGEEMEGTE